MTNELEKWRACFECINSALIVVNARQSIVLANTEACNLFGKTKDELQGVDFSVISNKQDNAEIEIYNRKKKIIRIVQMRVKPCVINKEHMCTVCLHDISKLKYIADKSHFDNIFVQHMSEGVMLTDERKRIIDINPAFTAITGYEANEVIGRKPSLLKSGVHDQKFYENLNKSLEKNSNWQGEIWSRKKNGDIYPEYLRISAIKDQQSETLYYIGIFQDLTLSKTQAKKTYNSNYLDRLTQLPNYESLIMEMYTNYLRQNHVDDVSVVVYISIDNLGELYREHGNNNLDPAVKNTINELQKIIGHGYYISRIGFSIFICLFRTNRRKSDKAISNCIKNIRSVFNKNYLSYKFKFNLGVSCFSGEKNLSAETLIQQAGEAAFTAKITNESHTIYDLKAEHRKKLYYRDMNDLQKAIKKNQLELYYQPKLNLSTGKIIGFEALIRWNHPTKGLLMPSRFIKMLDNLALAIQVGEWVLERAMQQLEVWYKQGLNYTVSVNIMPDHFLNNAFLPFLDHLVKKYPSVIMNYLEIEIIETHRITDLDKARQRLAHCRQFGVKSSLDDFGFAYSSLEHLSNLHVDVVKIDQGLIRGMTERIQNIGIIMSILNMTKDLNLAVIAEGVETIEIGSILLQLGCKLGQGYVISQPLPIKKVSRWIETWQPNPIWLTQKQLTLKQSNIVERIITAHLLLTQKAREAKNCECNRHCIFERVLDENAQKYSHYKEFDKLIMLHGQAHKLAKEIVSLRRQQQESLAMKKSGSLEATGGEIIHTLFKLFAPLE